MHMCEGFMEDARPQQDDESLDITAVMVFTVSALGLGGFSLFSLLDLIAF